MNASRAIDPTATRFVVCSPATRATLKPPPRLTVVTSGSRAAISSTSSATRVHTAGSLPDPMWVWSPRMTSRWRAASAFASSRYACQMPKLEAGPPVFVRLVEPLPRPGFTRMVASRPGSARP